MAASYLDRGSDRRRRTIGIVLTLAIHALLILLFLRLGPRQFVPMGDSGALTTFDVAREQAPQRRAAARPPAAAAPQRSVPRTHPEPVPTPPPIPFKDTSGVIWMTRDQYASTALKQSPARAAATGAGDAADGDDAGAGGGAGPKGVGAGPRGQTLYAAEWVREPTDAELRTYLPAVPPGSWGTIACRTVAGNRVEDCETIDESPVGSRLATGVRRAAWQFLVRPPRRNDQPMIGVWVRIRIEITQRGGAAVR